VATGNAIPFGTASGSAMQSMQNGLSKEIEKELKQLQKETKDLKRDVAERDQTMVELVELRHKLDPQTTDTKKKSSNSPAAGAAAPPRGWKEIKKEMAELKRWIEKREEEVSGLRKELEKANNNSGGGGKGKKASGKGEKETSDVSGGGGGEELEELKRRLKEREEELKRVMKQAEQQEEELEKMHHIVDTVTRSGDKSGTRPHRGALWQVSRSG
jgi:chromosome segregation ATPase